MSITSGRRDIGSGSKCREYPCTAGKYKKGIKKMEKFFYVEVLDISPHHDIDEIPVSLLKDKMGMFKTEVLN